VILLIINTFNLHLIKTFAI